MPFGDDSHPETISWRVHPARERMLAAVLALVVIAGLAWLSADLMQNYWWGIFSAAFLIVMLGRFFLPSYYSLDDEGISVRNLLGSTRFRWSDVRCFRHDAQGGFLSTRRRPSLLDSFRGIHLQFRENRDAVVARIQTSLPRAMQEGNQQS
ncbi:MAG: hypothetical protein Tsb009_30570 [Planctomycetaceae bacterium]